MIPFLNSLLFIFSLLADKFFRASRMSFSSLFVTIFICLSSAKGADTQLEIKFGYPEGGGFIAQTKIIEGTLLRSGDFIESPRGLQLHWNDLRLADPAKKRQIYKALGLDKNPRMELKNLKVKTPGLIEGIAVWSGSSVPFTAEYGFFGEGEVRFLFYLNLNKFNLLPIKINEREIDPIVDLILTLPYQLKVKDPKKKSRHL